MNYWTIRMLALIFLIFMLYFYLKGNKDKRRRSVAIIVVVLGLGSLSLSTFIPPENLIYSFPTPQKAFSYFIQNGEVQHIIEGDTTCLVCYKQSSNQYYYTIFERSDKGCLLPGFHAIETVKRSSKDNVDFDVLRLKGTGDYYLVGTFYSEHAGDPTPSILDKEGNQIYSFEIGEGTITLFYFFADDYESGYQFKVGNILYNVN